jgi:hypothetical protein
VRAVAVLLGAALVVAACGSGGSGEAATETSTSAVLPPSPLETTVPAPEPGAPPEPVDDPAAPAPPAAPVPGAPPGAPPQTTVPDGAPEPGVVGSLAATYLRPAASSAVVVEVRSQDGAGPRPAAVERVRQVLARITGKDVTVTVGSVGGAARSWTASELRAVADEGVAQAAGRPVLRLLFLHGGFAENERAVGVAVRGDVAAVFADRVAEAAGVFGDRAAVEDAVTMHEVGHLLGLVDLVLDTGREDPDHPGHSPNRGSVMYFAVESTLLGSVLSGGPPLDFDQDDLDDLARIRDS